MRGQVDSPRHLRSVSARDAVKTEAAAALAEAFMDAFDEPNTENRLTLALRIMEGLKLCE